MEREKYQQILQTWFYLLPFLKSLFYSNPRAREILRYSKNGLTDSLYDMFEIYSFIMM